MERQILHVDVNNAFLSWTAIHLLKQGETLDIRTIPAIIGGDEKQRHGIVLAKSPVAKQFGIKTGEPIYFARKKCPSIKIYSSDFKVYYSYSNALYQLLLEYTDHIERFSIDECFLDITQFLQNRTPLQIAYEISKRVREELGFTVNVGVAHNKLLAKMASDFQKPNKVHTLFEEEIPSKMWRLPVSELFMVGKQTLPKLEHMGIKKIGDLAKAEPKLLIKRFGKFGKLMWEYANGIDYSEVEYKKQDPKGIGNSITLSQDITDISKLDEVLLALTEQTTYRLRKTNMYASVISVQIKNSDFKLYSHQKKLEYPKNTTKEIFEVAKELLKEIYTGERIRLIGIRVEKLCKGEERQLSLFEVQDDKKQEKLDKIVDALKDKYGYHMVTRAGNMGNKITFKQEDKQE